MKKTRRRQSEDGATLLSIFSDMQAAEEGGAGKFPNNEEQQSGGEGEVEDVIQLVFCFINQPLL